MRMLMDNIRNGRWFLWSKIPWDCSPKPRGLANAIWAATAAISSSDSCGQDVFRFWRSVDDRTRAPDGGRSVRGPHPGGRRCSVARRAAPRWPRPPTGTIRAMADDDRFLFYGADDPHGYKCPMGSHIRRTNPRDSLEPNPGSEGRSKSANDIVSFDGAGLRPPVVAVNESR